MTGKDRHQLVSILGRLGSDHDGEREAAASLAEAFRRKHRVSWDDLVAKVHDVAPTTIYTTTYDETVRRAYAAAQQAYSEAAKRAQYPHCQQTQPAMKEMSLLLLGMGLGLTLSLLAVLLIGAFIV